MISALSLVLYQRRIKEVLYDQGNKVGDRLACYYLLDLMDVETGLIGVKSKVSYAGIALNISEKSRQGSKSVPMVFKPHAIRNAIQRLVDVGIFDRLSVSGKGNLLVLKACLPSESTGLNSHSSEDEKVRRKLAGSYHPETLIDKGSSSDSDDGSLQEVRTYLSPSFLPTNTPEGEKNNQEQQQQADNPLISIDLDWNPSAKFIASVKKRFNPDKVMIKKILLTTIEFAQYWSSRDLKLTQEAWEGKLLKNDLGPLLTTGEPRFGGGAKSSGGSFVKPLVKASVIDIPGYLNGRALQEWGVRHGFRMVNPGEDDRQYRGQLRVFISKVNLESEHSAAMGVRSRG